MRSIDWLQLALFVAALALITKPMGLYLVQVLDAKGRTWFDPVLRPLERVTYRLMGVQPDQEQDWKQYTLAMLLFSLVSCLFTYAILRLQHCCRSIRRTLGALSPGLAFNTAVSFTTNTNWQSYGGESTLSYFSQMVALVFHNFVSAATGIAHRGGAGARHRAALGQDLGQLLGGSGADHLLPAAADLSGVRRVPGIAGHDPELQALHQSEAVGADEDLRGEEERPGRDRSKAPTASR